MVKLAGIFGQMRPFRALVIGDFMFDAYTEGRAKRVSPEAPVLVLQVERSSFRPGGAGNVALNLAALGASVHVCGRIGSDAEGELLIDRLKSSHIETEGLLREMNYKTPIKNRLMADNQQLLRVDIETVAPLLGEYEAQVIAYLEDAIAKMSVVAVSDYGKGFLTHSILAAAIAIAKRYNVPLVVDPKGTDFTKYRGAFLIKPNVGEAYGAAKLSNSYSLDQVAKILLEQTQVKHLLITRSEEGISYYDKDLCLGGGQIQERREELYRPMMDLCTVQ